MLSYQEDYLCPWENMNTELEQVEVCFAPQTISVSF
jgi:hypothetical protein